jgi:protease secretion system outer membrane protein
MIKKQLYFGLLSLAALGFSASVCALDLNEAFLNARINDAKFKGAEADLTINNYQATLALTAFFPTLSYSYREIIDSSMTTTSPLNARNTFTVTQPIFSLEKLDQLKQSKPREEFARSLFMTNEQDLASRLYTAVSSLIIANEALKSSDTRIQNLKMQLARSTRMLELGQGTITDKRDIETRYQQAVASRVNFMINKRTAQMQIFTLCRIQPGDGDFQLLEKHKQPQVDSFDKIIANVLENNPSLLAAKSTEEISRLEASRARSQLMPTVSLSYNQSSGGNSNDTNSMQVNVSVPLDASKVIARLSANASEAKAFEQRRQTEDQILLQTNQYYESVILGYQALKDKRLAVEAAQLSVEANERSSQAGVRTMIEVLNSIESLFQSKNDYATTAVNVGTAYLNLLLINATPPTEAVAQTQNFLFGN